MNALIQKLDLADVRTRIEVWFDTQVLAVDSAVEIGLIVLALLLGSLLGPRLRRTIEEATEHWVRQDGVRGVLARLAALSTPITILILLWIAVESGSRTALFGHRLTQIAASLVGAWVAIRLASGFIRNDLLARTVAWLA